MSVLASSETKGRHDMLPSRIDRKLFAIAESPFRRPALFFLLCAAAVLYLSSVMYGLPQELDSDERLFFNAAVELLQNGTLDPDWYGAPAQPLIYLLALIIAFIAVIGTIFGQFETFADVGPYFLDNVTLFYAAGRIANVAVTLACLWLTDRLIRKIGIDGLWRWIALVLLCLSPLWSNYASIVRMDMMQIFFMLAILLFCIDAIARKSPIRNLVLAGACLGVAVTSKYPAIVSVVPIITSAALLIRSNTWSLRDAIRALALAAAASLAAAFVTGPYLFLNFAGVLQDVIWEARDSHLGYTGRGFFPQFSYYMLDVLPSALTSFGFVLGLAGLVAIGRRSEAGMLIGIFAAVYLVFISSLSLQWARWTLPLLPLLVVGIAAGGQAVETYLHKNFADSRVKSGFSSIFAICALVFLAPTTISVTQARATNNDTRVEALNWIEANIPPGSQILSETYAPALRVDLFELHVPSNQVGIDYWRNRSKRARPYGFYGRFPKGWAGDVNGFREALAAREIEYVVMSDGFFSRYAEDQDNASSESRFYEVIFEDYQQIKSFEKSRFKLGPEILVLKRRIKSDE